MAVTVTYSLTESNELLVEYNATTTEDTVLNLTHHSYFNLDGHEHAVTQQELFVNADRVIEKNHQNIPTGRVLAVAESAFDFWKLKTVQRLLMILSFGESEKKWRLRLQFQKQLTFVGLYQSTWGACVCGR